MELALQKPYEQQPVVHLESAYSQFNPKNRRYVKEAREACRLLRRTGARVIHERKIAMQNGEDVPKDILTQIIKTAATGYVKKCHFVLLPLHKHRQCADRRHTEVSKTALTLLADGFPSFSKVSEILIIDFKVNSIR